MMPLASMKRRSDPYANIMRPKRKRNEKRTNARKTIAIRGDGHHRRNGLRRDPPPPHPQRAIRPPRRRLVATAASPECRWHDDAVLRRARISGEGGRLCVVAGGGGGGAGRDDVNTKYTPMVTQCDLATVSFDAAMGTLYVPIYL